MNHRQKIKMARKLRSREEIKKHTPIFLTQNWMMRHDAIKDRVDELQRRKYSIINSGVEE